MADLYLPVQDDMTALKGSTVSRGWQLFLQKLIQQLGTMSGTGTVTHTGTLTDHAVIVGNGGADIQALGSLGTTTTVLHGNASADPAFGAVVEADFGFTDITTANVSTTKHGLAPKLPNNATEYLDGTGAYTVPSGSIFKTAILNITNAQWKALPTTPLTLVAAPGSGFRVKAFSATVITNFGLGAYTNLDASYLAFQVTNPAGQWITFPIVDDATQTPTIGQMTHLLSASNLITDLPAPYLVVPSTGNAGQQYVLVNGTNASGDTVANWDNAAVVVNIDNNGSGNLTGGNVGNTARVIFYYTVEAI